MLSKISSSFGRAIRAELPPIAFSLLLVGLVTATVAALFSMISLDHVAIIYLIPVLVAALRWGVLPAIVAAVGGILVTAFFFYPPIYDFRVSKAEHIVDLMLFVFVAIVTGRLATTVRQARSREQADALREALIGSVSHELRTPLSTIMGSASVLAQSPAIAQDARLVPLVDGLRQEAERLNDDIQNLLDATRISNEGIRPHPQWVDPADIVNAAIERKRRLLADHKLHLSIAEDLPFIRVDATMIDRAFGLLIENATKYSPVGSPIDIVAEQTGQEVRLAVRDQGIGLSMEELGRIWDRFYRSPRVRDSVAGSGLGLWIAHSLVRACGGHMQAFSAGVGRGAMLAIYLPIGDDVAEQSND